MLSRTGPVSAGAVLALVGAVMLVFVCSLIAFRGWPGVRQSDATQQVVLEAPAAPPGAPEQSVVLGGVKDAARSDSASAAPVDEAVPPADRDGLAGAADDVVSTLDKVIP